MPYPISSPKNRISDTVYGDGSLLYPGSVKGVDGPCGSFRLVMIRDGIEEYEMLTMLEAAAGREIFYYVNDRASVEIDFVMESDRVYPVEVKAETNLKSKSLKSVLDKYPDSTGWRFSMNDFKEQERITNIPLYLAGEWISTYATSIN